MTAWRTFSIRARLLIGFLAMALLVLLTGAVGLFSGARIQAGFSSVFDTRFPAVTMLLESDRDLHQLLVAERSLLFAEPGSDEFAGQLEDYEENLRQAGERWDKYKALALGPDERALVSQYEAARAKWISQSRAVVDARRRGDTVGAQAASLGETKQAFDEMREFLNKGQEINDALIVATDADTTAVYRSQRRLLLLASTAGLGLGLALAWLVSGGITREVRRVAGALRDGTDQVIGAAAQVSTSAQGLSQGASAQAAALEQTSASLQALGAITRENAANSEQASSLAGEVNDLVSRSDSLLAELVASMRGIDESSAKVANIIKTVDEIAFQTNILALNAAVEAARAGEAGMGFAVVADEVRALAQRAAQAARDTSSLIELSRSSARAGAANVDAVVASFEQLTSRATRVHGIAVEVSAGSRRQTEGIDQITQALEQIEKVTHTTAATAEESAAASEELTAQAEVTGGLVADLERLVEGGGSTQHSADAPTPRRVEREGRQAVRRAA